MNTPDRNPNEQPPGDELLSAYLDNEMSAADRAALESQLEQDPALRESLAELATLSQMLHKLPPQALSDRFAEGVLRRAERQMLLGDAAPSPIDTSVAVTPTVPDTSQGASLRRYWWIPAALAALLAGLLFLPSLIPRANVAQMDEAPNATQPAARESPANHAVARLEKVEDRASAEPAHRQEAMGRLPQAVPPIAKVAQDADAPADSFRDLAMTDELSADAEEMVISPAAPAPTLAFEATVEDLQHAEDMEAEERAAEQREGMLGETMAGEAKANNLASTTWRYEQDPPLIEVEMPLVAGPGASLDAVAEQATPSEAVRGAAGALIEGRRGVTDAGQLYAIQGPPEELVKLLDQYKRQGATIRDHELPRELRSQLARQDTQRWSKSSAAGRADAPSDQQQAGRDGKASQMDLQLHELRANDPLRGWLKNLKLQITIVELADSAALARVAEQHVRRAAGKKAQVTTAPAAQVTTAPAAQVTTAPAGKERNETLLPEIRQPTNAPLERAPRALADDRSGKNEAAVPHSAQLYLWVHRRSPLEIDTPASEPPRGNNGD